MADAVDAMADRILALETELAASHAALAATAPASAAADGAGPSLCTDETAGKPFDPSSAGDFSGSSPSPPPSLAAEGSSAASSSGLAPLSGPTPSDPAPAAARPSRSRTQVNFDLLNDADQAPYFARPFLQLLTEKSKEEGGTNARSGAEMTRDSLDQLFANLPLLLVLLIIEAQGDFLFESDGPELVHGMIQGLSAILGIGTIILCILMKLQLGLYRDDELAIYVCENSKMIYLPVLLFIMSASGSLTSQIYGAYHEHGKVLGLASAGLAVIFTVGLLIQYLKMETSMRKLRQARFDSASMLIERKAAAANRRSTLSVYSL